MTSTESNNAAARLTGRRRFLTTATAAGFGALAMSGLANGQAADPASAGLRRSKSRRRDADILNFALNLEYLEAEFYLRAIGENNGLDGNTSGSGDAGDVVGGKAVPFAIPAIASYAQELAADEKAHVLLLRTALGNAKVARPALNLDKSFSDAVVAAGILTADDAPFDAYASDVTFLLAAFIFEDVGVTAYKGAAPLLLNPNTLSAAAGLLAVEAYHAANIRTALFALKDEEVKPGLTVGMAVQMISDLRDALDGADDLDQGILGTDGMASNIVPTDANGLAFSRTPRQVLNIVYGAPSSPTAGLFFPAGVNGQIA